jgi:hypothetical protein
MELVNILLRFAEVLTISRNLKWKVQDSTLLEGVRARGRRSVVKKKNVPFAFDLNGRWG